jgi:hypothetical protein
MKKFDPEVIQKRNEAFWKKDKVAQRVAIAKDVLKQLADKKYFARKMCYISNNVRYSGAEDLQAFLLNKNPKCECCALGVSFLSLARLGDKLSLSDRDYRGTLAPIFGKKQVALIETTFEGWGKAIGGSKAGEAFFQKYPEPNERMKAIFKNIVKNKGVFRP